MDTLYIRNDELRPPIALFSASWFIRRVLTEADLSIYAQLRARGFQPLDSFIAAFGAKVVGRLESLQEASAQLERSHLYQLAYERAAESIPEEELIAELAARAEEMSGYTQMEAQALRVKPQPQREPANMTPVNNEASDEAAYKSALELQGKRELARIRHEREEKALHEFGSALDVMPLQEFRYE